MKNMHEKITNVKEVMYAVFADEESQKTLKFVFVRLKNLWQR